MCTFCQELLENVLHKTREQNQEERSEVQKTGDPAQGGDGNPQDEHEGDPRAITAQHF